MAKRSIFAIGFDLPELDGFSCFPVNCDQSLLEANIILFRPHFDDFDTDLLDPNYNGRRCLSQKASFEAAEKITHWASQLKLAFETGKTVIAFLAAREEVYRYTGTKEFSGSGRSRVTTNHIANIFSYSFLPIKFDELVIGKGREMKLGKDSEVISKYWSVMSSISQYEAHFSIQHFQPLILTKTAEKVVGALLNGKGKFLCLPDLNVDFDELVNDDGHWNDKAKVFVHKLRDAVFEIDAFLNQEYSGQIDEPEWVRQSAYRFKSETAIETEILGLGEKIEALVKERESKREGLKYYSSLRGLLFAKGTALEASVREALRILGFHAENFKSGESEFDAVFISDEGRFLGEVEGRDNKAIAVEKYSQLERNINEDFARDEISAPAKAVLFGNAYRVLPLAKRGACFTDKVLSAAKRTGCALVSTSDLFVVVQHLKNHPDPEFAKKCREAIAASDGALVVFPNVPAVENKTNRAPG